MKTFQVVLFALFAASISCKHGCYDAHKFAQKMNHVVGNGSSVAAEYYKSADWMNNGQKTGQREAGSYTEAHNYMKSNSRRGYKECVALELSSLYTTYWQAKNKQMSHYCKGSPSDRAKIFSKTNDRVAENVAWASNIRSCEWAILAWITDDGIASRGHRVNVYGNNDQTGCTSDGYYYSQQNGTGVEAKDNFNKDAAKFGIFTRYNDQVASTQWDRVDA